MENIYVCPGCGLKYSNLKEVASCVAKDVESAEKAEKRAAERREKAAEYEKEIQNLYIKVKEAVARFNHVSDERKACTSLTFTSNGFSTSNSIKSLTGKYNMSGRSELDKLIDDVFGF